MGIDQTAWKRKPDPLTIDEVGNEKKTFKELLYFL